MKTSFISKKATIINKLAREMLEINKQIVIQRPQQAVMAIKFINEKTSELFDQVAAATSEDELNNAWLNYSVIMAGYIMSHDLLIDID